jgi:integrase/recombinase XerD
MPRVSKLQLSFDRWPDDDRTRLNEAFRPGDLFDEDKRGAHLSQATRNALQVSYGQHLRFLSDNHPELLDRPPEKRVDRKLIAEYVALLKKTNQNQSIATNLHHLRFALQLICPNNDWSWLLIITKRIAAAASPRPRKLGMVSSDKLYLLGIELMRAAIAKSSKSDASSKAAAMQYRDGLLIALLAVFALRRRTVAAIKIDAQLSKVGHLWALEMPPRDVKGKRALDFTLSTRLSTYVDVYLRKFRPLLPGAVNHNGLWPSNKGVPLSSNAIYDAVCKRTVAAFGYRVNPHHFRHAAGTLWSIEDPKNIRGIKDLFGHASFDKTTEVHYLMSRSRIAGRKLARAIEAATKGSAHNAAGDVNDALRNASKDD